MKRSETKANLNAILTVIGSRGLSGLSAQGVTLHDMLDAIHAFPEHTTRDEQRALVANLRRLGLIEVGREGNVFTVQPSVKGVHRLQRAEIEKLFVQPQTKWDGSWRMVSYDIPARYARQRRLLTSELHRLGFSLVKDSTWFHPYPCFDVISELIAYCGLTQFVMIAEIARLDEATLGRLLRRYPDLR